MGLDVTVEIVSKQRIDPFGVLAPFPLSFEEENVVFEERVDGSPSFGKYADIKASAYEMGIVVDVNISGLFVVLEAVEVDAFLVVPAEIITYYDIAVSSLHDAAEPHIVVAVVVLDEGIYTVVIGIESATVFAVIAHIAVRFVVLDLDTVGIETKDAVSGVVSAAVGQYIVFINSVLADACDDTVAAGTVDVVSGHIDFGPKIAINRLMVAKLDAPAG